jgi:hypothetical protein
MLWIERGFDKLKESCRLKRKLTARIKRKNIERKDCRMEVNQLKEWKEGGNEEILMN